MALRDHSDGGAVTEGQDTKEDTINAFGDVLDNSQNKPSDFSVTAGGTFNLDTPEANLDLFLESGLIRLIGTPAGATTIKVPDGEKRVAFENVSGQATTIDTVTGAAAPVAIANGATKTIHIRGVEITIVADDATQTGALLADGTVNASGNFNWADFELKRPLLIDYAEKSVVLTAAATIDVDMELGNYFEATLDQATTFTFSNPPATGKAGSFTLIIKQDATGSRTVALPAGVDWENSTAPVFSTAANAVDIVSFITNDAGTIWYGFLGGKAFG